MSAASLRSLSSNSLTGSPGCDSTGSGYLRILRIICVRYVTKPFRCNALFVPGSPKHQRRKKYGSVAGGLFNLPILEDFLCLLHLGQRVGWVEVLRHIVIGCMACVLQLLEPVANGSKLPGDRIGQDNVVRQVFDSCCPLL